MHLTCLCLQKIKTKDKKTRKKPIQIGKHKTMVPVGPEESTWKPVYTAGETKVRSFYREGFAAGYINVNKLYENCHERYAIHFAINCEINFQRH